MIHELKILPSFFDAVVKGEKNFEIRKNDRPFLKGDYLALNEYGADGYTGRSCVVYVDYILSDSEYVKDGMVVMAIKPCGVVFHQVLYDPLDVAKTFSVPIIYDDRCKSLKGCEDDA